MMYYFHCFIVLILKVKLFISFSTTSASATYDESGVLPYFIREVPPHLRPSKRSFRNDWSLDLITPLLKDSASIEDLVRLDY